MFKFILKKFLSWSMNDAIIYRKNWRPTAES